MSGGLLIPAERAARAIVARSTTDELSSDPHVVAEEGSDAASAASLIGGERQEMQQGVQAVESGLLELGETLNAIALKPYDPPVEPRALLRLLLVLRTLDEPDEMAGTA